MDNTHRSFFRSLMSVRRCDISPAFPLSGGMVGHLNNTKKADPSLVVQPTKFSINLV